MIQEKKTLRALAEEHGQLVRDAEDNSPYGWKHRVADHLHGWSSHEYHYQADPVMLTSEEYLAALEGAGGGADGAYVVHSPAVAVPPSPTELAQRIDSESDRIKKLRDEKNKAKPVKEGVSQ